VTAQSWTPAPKKGIIPLHPLPFGTLLGKAFAALRHNPKVLFGFAVVVQLVVTVVTAAVMGVVLVATFSRLATVTPGSPDFEALMFGTIGINLLAGVLLALATVAFTAMMQGVVAADIGYAAIGVKASLGMLWKKMLPAFWRLLGFSALAIAAVFGVGIVVALIIVGLIAGGINGGQELVGVGVLVIVLIVLGCIPLYVWLSTKLLLVPSILVLEHGRFREALVRSWRLTRGRFWVAFGVTALIGVIMNVAMQVVGVPMSLLTQMIVGVVAPTGSTEVSQIIGIVLLALVPQVLVIALQAITLVVQSTAGALVYLDCRMRYEGLDQTLVAHVERRELGWADDQLGDPYAVDPARAVTSAPPPRQLPEHVMMTAPYATAPGWNASYPGQYPGQQAAPAGYGYPAAQTAPPAGYAPSTPSYPASTNGYPPASTPAYPAPAPGYPAPAPGHAVAPPAPPQGATVPTAPPAPPSSADSGWAAPGDGNPTA
jgi:hypothetical protein